MATGRRPNIESLGLAELGIITTPDIEVDRQLRTDRRNIFAIGDVNGLNMLDSAAASQARVKIVAERSTRQISGCVAIGNQASEVINLAALAIQCGIGTREIDRLLMVHPSASVAFQRCAAKFN